jgi:hypothetical protein
MSKKLDFTQLAFRTVQKATHQELCEAEPALESPKAEAGRKGGKKGGAARAAKLSPEERSAIARKAAAARWKKGKP